MMILLMFFLCVAPIIIVFNNFNIFISFIYEINFLINCMGYRKYMNFFNGNIIYKLKKEVLILFVEMWNKEIIIRKTWGAKNCQI